MAKRKFFFDDPTKVEGASTPKGIKEKHNDRKKKKAKKPASNNEADKPANTATNPQEELKEPPGEKWSKSKKKHMRQLQAKARKGETEGGSARQTTEIQGAKPDSSSSTETGKLTGKMSSLQESFISRLSGSRFRILNEELYTTTSIESFDRFSKNPELFTQYHEGFRTQVEAWPVNPIDVIVRWLSNKYKTTLCVVADFGCGDAQLAKELLKIKQKGKCPFKVHSFDLVSNDSLVTACDMANVPLEDKSVDVCVFCLSLMGTNLADFVREAHRVLKDDGVVKIAEVRSRIEYSHAASQKTNSKKQKSSDDDNSNPKALKEKSAGTLKEFVDVLGTLGFAVVNTDRSNKMFLTLELKKNQKAPNRKIAFTAKPCIYKRR
jgi:ribosomal RNA-processing protein 8